MIRQIIAILHCTVLCSTCALCNVHCAYYVICLGTVAMSTSGDDHLIIRSTSFPGLIRHASLNHFATAPSTSALSVANKTGAL